MTRASKAMLLSVLLFPGSGLFLLQKRLWGLLLTGGSAVALWVLLRTALAMAQALRDQILSGEIPLQVPAILEAVHAAAAASGSQANLASLVFLGCWVVGVVLTWRASGHTAKQR